MSTAISIYRRGTGEVMLPGAPNESAEISDDIPLKVFALMSSDKSDLNQLVVVGFKARDALAVRACVPWSDGDYRSPEFAQAIRGVLLYAIENAAELRDLLKVNT
jgi:hypothetical protein